VKGKADDESKKDRRGEEVRKRMPVGSQAGAMVIIWDEIHLGSASHLVQPKSTLLCSPLAPALAG
jgi:hypothetical protein